MTDQAPVPLRITFVRHAETEIDPHVPPARWELGETGFAAARDVVEKLPADALLVSSPEPKAWQTIDPDDQGHAYRDDRFREVDRPDGLDADFTPIRLAYLAGEVGPDWEPHAEVVARFDEGLADAQAHAEGRPIVVATHGLALTVWLAARTGLADPGAFWAALKMPDILTVDLNP